MPKIQVGGQEVDVQVGPGGAEVTVGESTVKFDAEGNMIGAQAFGSALEKVEGGMLITRPNGTQLKVNDDGSYTLVTPPKSVGISDISKVASYSISAEGDASVHRVTFLDGGYAHVKFEADGQFAALSGHHIGQSINNDNELFIRQHEDRKPPENV